MADRLLENVLLKSSRWCDARKGSGLLTPGSRCSYIFSQCWSQKDRNRSVVRVKRRDLGKNSTFWLCDTWGLFCRFECFVVCDMSIPVPNCDFPGARGGLLVKRWQEASFLRVWNKICGEETPSRPPQTSGVLDHGISCEALEQATAGWGAMVNRKCWQTFRPRPREDSKLMG